jgi:hypothetical protein
MPKSGEKEISRKKANSCTRDSWQTLHRYPNSFAREGGGGDALSKRMPQQIFAWKGDGIYTVTYIISSYFKISSNTQIELGKNILTTRSSD